jgi:tetratricopeptide (TPR) repeat protein
MTLRIIGMLALLIVAGCTANQAIVREPQPAPAPVVHAPPVVIVPKPAPAPRLPPPETEAPPAQLVPDKPLPVTPVSTLLASVQAAVAAGELDRGAALGERALRISPRDAQLWYQLALIRTRQHRIDDAAGAAKRALSLAGRDAALQQQINALLQELAGKDAAKPAP